MTLLNVVDLKVELQGRGILRGIDLAVAAGEIVTVLGRNGVGKTTLLRTISGLYRPTSGTIDFDGGPIGGLPPHTIVARGLAQSPEGRQLFGDMPVIENLRAGGLTLSAAAFAERLDEIERLFPVLHERRAQLAGSLSGGEQQMLCIGRALIGRPRLLVLDEPSLGLAPRIVGQIFALIAEIRSRGTAVLVVEQNARLALGLADRAYVLDQGQVVLSGPASELAADPRVVAAYLGAVA
ncbi:MAG: ABC transporter ATP-binding protein [Xanthomonadales bacterium]|nr:ABC transporter ATP-binding protein [Xanthomonadales bacterium]